MISKRRKAAKQWREQYEMQKIERMRLLRLSECLLAEPVWEGGAE